MKFIILFPGKTREKYIDMGIIDYAKRLERFVQVECIIVKSTSSGRIPREVQKKNEARLLLDKCTDATYLVALDPGGQESDSEGLARNIATWEDRGLRNIHFVIGGHYGLHEDILSKADYILSLSRLTFTHEMTRLILFEQLYRGCMINAGRSYHY